MKRCLLVPCCFVLLFLSFSGRAERVCADVLVCSLLTDQVLRYDSTTGAYLGVFASGALVDGPEGITIGPDGNVYVASEYSHNVTKWSPGGSYLGEFVSPGSGGLLGEMDLQFGPDGNLYVISHLTFDPLMMWKFDGTTGAFISKFGAPGGAGNFYVGQLDMTAILKYDSLGTALGPAAIDPVGFPTLLDIVIGPDGNIYTSSSSPGNVRRYDGTTGAFMGVFASVPSGSPTWGMQFHTDGNLYVSAGTGVARFDGTTGAFLGALVPPGSGVLSGAAGLTFISAIPEPGVGWMIVALLLGLSVRRNQWQKKYLRPHAV
jgi:WD40 repeat protein